MKNLMVLAPILSGISWGTTGIFVRKLNEMGMNNTTIMFSRVSLAVVMMFIGIMICKRSMLKIRIKDLWLIIGAALIGTLGLNLCYNESIAKLTLSLAAVLLGMSPVFVLLLAAIFFHERITLKKVICMVLAILGCAMVSGVFEEVKTIPLSVSGLLIGILSGFLYALYSIFSKFAMERGYHAVTIIFYCLLIICAVLMPFADYHAIGTIISMAPAKNFAMIFVHSLLCSVMPYLLFTISLQYMDAGKASILASTEPVAAMVFGLIFFDEIPTIISVSGLITVIVALAVLSMPDKKQENAEIETIETTEATSIPSSEQND